MVHRVQPMGCEKMHSTPLPVRWWAALSFSSFALKLACSKGYSLTDWYFVFYYIYFNVYGGCTHMSWPACDGQKTACMDWFSLPSTMCALGIELRLASLVTSVFNY